MTEQSIEEQFIKALREHHLGYARIANVADYGDFIVVTYHGGVEGDSYYQLDAEVYRKNAMSIAVYLLDKMNELIGKWLDLEGAEEFLMELRTEIFSACEG